MRSKDYSVLGKLLTAANTWRTNAATEGVDLNIITAEFPNGENVTLKWMQETTESTDPTTGASIVTVTWEGWDVQTKSG